MKGHQKATTAAYEITRQISEATHIFAGYVWNSKLSCPRATTTIPSKVQKKRGIINSCAGYMVMCTSSRLRRRHSSTTAFQKRSRLSRCRHRELAWNLFSNTVKAGRHFRPRPCGAKESILSRAYPEKRTTAASALQRQWFVDTGYSSDWYQNLACEFLHSDIRPELGDNTIKSIRKMLPIFYLLRKTNVSQPYCSRPRRRNIRWLPWRSYRAVV